MLPGEFINIVGENCSVLTYFVRMTKVSCCVPSEMHKSSVGLSFNLMWCLYTVWMFVVINFKFRSFMSLLHAQNHLTLKSSINKIVYCLTCISEMQDQPYICSINCASCYLALHYLCRLVQPHNISFNKVVRHICFTSRHASCRA